MALLKSEFVLLALNFVDQFFGSVFRVFSGVAENALYLAFGLLSQTFGLQLVVTHDAPGDFFCFAFGLIHTPFNLIFVHLAFSFENEDAAGRYGNHKRL